MLIEKKEEPMKDRHNYYLRLADKYEIDNELSNEEIQDKINEKIQIIYEKTYETYVNTI